MARSLRAGTGHERFQEAPAWKLWFSAFPDQVSQFPGEGPREEPGIFTQGLQAITFGLSWGLEMSQSMLIHNDLRELPMKEAHTDSGCLVLTEG